MNGLVLASDVRPERLASLRRRAAELGATTVDELRTAGPHTLLRVGTDAVLVADGDTGTTAAFGSGVRTLDETASPLGSDTDRLLDGADADLVAMRLEAGGAADVAIGGGNHRVHRAAFPEGGSMASTHLGLLARVVGPDDLRTDRSAEDFLLGFGFYPDGRTPYRDVSTLAAGQRHRLDAGGGVQASAGIVAPSGGDAAATVPSFDAAVDELFARFEEVVADQAGDDEHHAVLLGGFDSALVAGTLRRMGHDVATFTFSFGDERFEQRGVGAIVDAVGAEHHWVRLDADRVFSGIEAFADLFAQPGSQPHYQVHTLRASEDIREAGFGHTFSGDGCDALFLGYPTVNTRARIVGALDRIPAPVLRAVLSGLTTTPVDRRLGHVARMARSTVRALLLPWPAQGHLPTQYLDEWALSRLRTDAPPLQDETIEEIRVRLASAVSDLDATRLAFHGSGATGQSRVKVDGSVAATGVLQRTPFQDPRLKSFVGSLPTEYLRPPGSAAAAPGKELLVAMARRYRLLPDEVIDLPKQSPSDSPIDSWYAGPLRSRVLAQLRGLPFAVDLDYVSELLAPKRAEALYRERVSIAHHALQPIGLLCAYAAFTALAGSEG